MKRAILILLALSVVAAPAVAQEGEADDVSHGEAELVTVELAPFDAIDRNADEYVSWEEIRNEVTKIFYDSDTDGNNILSREEFAFDNRHWRLSDVNGNNEVNLRELQAHAAIVFGEADTNGDDKLSRAEGAAARERENLN